MIKKPTSTQFTFILDNEQTMNNLDHLKMNNYDRFLKTIEIGKQVQALSKQDQCEKLEQLFSKHPFDAPYLKLELQDAFISAFNLRNYKTVKYFLENGIQINTIVQDAALSVCYSLEYLSKEEAPIELLQLILEYGANPRYASQQESQTAIHLASSYGNLPFVKKLVEYGADINAVNDNRKTPLGLAIEKKRADVVEYLKSKNASAKWNE